MSMFAGIVEEAAIIEAIVEGNAQRRIVVRSSLDLHDTHLGDSICISGTCLTVVAHENNLLSFDVIAETLRRTSLGQRKVGHRVNLERSIRMGERNSGHFVFGHVDGVAELVERNIDGESIHLLWRYPNSLGGYFAPKGSVGIDGVSLTVGEVTSETLSVYIIPHTAELTTLGAMKVGETANLEIDMLSRYVRSHLQAMQSGSMYTA